MYLELGYAFSTKFPKSNGVHSLTCSRHSSNNMDKLAPTVDVIPKILLFFLELES